MMRMDFWARFHRRFHFSINPQGIHFDYNGDEVTWIYPWKRKGLKRRFLSISFCDTFPSLKEIDKEWESFGESLYQKEPYDIYEKDIS